MGRAERALIFFLCVCIALVGFLTIQSRGGADAAGAQRAAAAASVPDAPEPGGQLVMDAAASLHASATLVTSTRPAPLRDLSVIRGRISGGSRGTYVAHLLLNNDSLLSRWPERYQTPVKVWIQSNSDLPGWSGEVTSLMRRALGAWHSIHVPVRFEFVSDSAAAEVVVNWSTPFSGSQVGATRRYRDQHGWIVRAEISIALRISDGQPIDKKYLSAVMIHEVGHALGLDHSPHSTDVMAPRTSTVFEPTGQDQATLALIYSIPPGSLK